MTTQQIETKRTLNSFNRHVKVKRVYPELFNPLTGESLIAKKVAIKYLLTS